MTVSLGQEPWSGVDGGPQELKGNMEFLHHSVSFFSEAKRSADRVLTVGVVLEVGGFKFFGFGY